MRLLLTARLLPNEVIAPEIVRQMSEPGSSFGRRACHLDNQATERHVLNDYADQGHTCVAR